MNYDELIMQDKTGEMMKTNPDAQYFSLVSRKEVTALLCMMPIGYSNKRLYQEVYGFESLHEPYYDAWRSIYCDKKATEHEKNEAVKIADRFPSYYDKILDSCLADGGELIRVGDRINKEKLSEKSDEELSNLANDLFEGIRRMSVYLLVPISLQSHLEEKLKNMLSEKVSDSRKAEEYFQALTVSLKDNSGYFEQVDILNLAVAYKESGSTDAIKTMVDEHAKKYGSIGVKYGIGEFWTSDDIVERLEILKDQSPEDQLQHVKNLPDEREKKIEEIFIELNADDEFKSLVKVARLFVYLRTYRTDVISNTFANVFPLFEEMGKRKGLTRKAVIDCTPNEIISMNFPSAGYIASRAESFICKSINGKTYYTFGEPAKKLKEELESRIGGGETDETLSELKGMVAFKGKVQGKAKIILDNTDLSKVERGDILVAAMTTPDFVPAMEKAAGFVTDEGGILCHAAIISREMKKPCVIGTKFATKILKDGDLIEADADKGIVRKINE